MRRDTLKMEERRFSLEAGGPRLGVTGSSRVVETWWMKMLTPEVGDTLMASGQRVGGGPKVEVGDGGSVVVKLRWPQWWGHNGGHRLGVSG